MFAQMIIIHHSFFGASFSKKIPTQSGSTFRPSPWPRLDDGNVVISPSHATQDHDPTAGGTEKRHGTPGSVETLLRCPADFMDMK